MKNFSGVCQAAGADKPLRAFFIWITNIVTLSTSREDHCLILSGIIAEPVPTCRISIITHIRHRDGHGNVSGYSIKSICKAHGRRSRHTGDGFDCGASGKCPCSDVLQGAVDLDRPCRGAPFESTGSDTHDCGRKAYFFQAGASAAQFIRNLRDGGRECESFQRSAAPEGSLPQLGDGGLQGEGFQPGTAIKGIISNDGKRLRRVNRIKGCATGERLLLNSF